MDIKIPDFFSIHVHPQQSDPWEDKKSSLESEDCKMKGNCEGDEIIPRFFVGDHKTMENEGDVVNGDEGYFISDPK